MEKKYIVRLTHEERSLLKAVIKKLKGSSEKVRRAHVLLAPMRMARTGLTKKLRTHIPAGRRQWRTFANGW